MNSVLANGLTHSYNRSKFSWRFPTWNEEMEMGRRRKRRGKSMSSYFRAVFAEKPHWLEQTSNDEILARYRTDHGLAADADVGKSAKQTLANIKSVLRKEHRV